VALALDAVPGRPPHYPWEAGELTVVTEALSSLHRDLTPSPLPSLTPLAEYVRHMFGGWAELAAMETPPAGLEPWAASHLESLAELESGWPAACEGPTLLHGDVRADNVLLTAGEVVFVDWPHASVGSPVFDVVAWAPSVVLEGGPPPEELLARHVAPVTVDPDVVTVLLAAVAGFFVERSFRPPPPGLPTIRAFQAAQGGVALEWLRRRTGW
jgi:Ser/Thr protein kinase RdoA (MazF antagonist)